MSASKSAVACVVSMLLLDVVSAASMRVPVAVPDPLNALLSDPIAKAKYVTAVNAACADFSDGFEGVPPQVLHVTSGGYAVRVSAHTVTITDPLGHNTVQHWGDPHENLNGKHIKDWGGGPQWAGMHRTLLLGDGSKITMQAQGPHGVTEWTSIYDGHNHLQIDNCRSEIAWRGSDAIETENLEQAQHDGEAATFDTDTQTGVATYSNLYNEDESFNRVETPQPLGTTGGYANPNQVNDLFDDPRLGHT